LDFPITIIEQTTGKEVSIRTRNKIVDNEISISRRKNKEDLDVWRL
jgi:hypothetical protein